MKNIFVMGVILALVSFLLSGCGGDGDPVSTGLPSGSGYKVQLAASSGSISHGGSVTLIASVFDPNGNPIADGAENKVLFSSSLAGKFGESSGSGSIATQGGVATVVYTDGSTATEALLCHLTATYRGAVAVLDLPVAGSSF